jgi:hypothetical protein
MTIKIRIIFRIFLFSFSFMTFMLTSSCNLAQRSNRRPPLEADGMRAYSAIFDQIANELIQAWNRREPDLMHPYISGDIVHHDNNSELATDDDSRLSLLSRSFLANPNYEARLSSTFIGRHDGFIVNESWNWEPVITGESWTIDHPLIEYHWITFYQGKISNWWLMYDQNLHSAIDNPLDQTLLQDYAIDWSSGDPEVVANLYTPQGVRQDPLFEEYQKGSSAVKEFAAKFFTWYPGVRMDLLQSFGEIPADKKIGGVYAIHISNQYGIPCDVLALILLELDNEKIDKEWVFYQADSLLACDWAH